MKKNFIYQFIYKLVILFIPLIISPILTRRLGDTNLGIYSYVYSIATYFVILSMLGINKYSIRVISSSKNDEKLLRIKVWSLFYDHLIVSIISLLSYFILSIIVGGNDKIIYYIQGIYVASSVIDISWLFTGLEKFKKLIVRNLIVKILECVSIIIFVKNKNDLYIYTFIMSLSIFIGQAIMLPQAIKIVKPIKVSYKDMIEHIKPICIFFISVLATNLYTIFDKTLLGWLSTKENVAYYEYANKIITMGNAIVAVISTITFPRVCTLIKNNLFKECNKIFNYSLFFVNFISFGFIFGLLGIGNELAIIYFSEEFAICGKFMIFLSPLILFVGISDIIRTQFMIPLHMDIKYTVCTIICAIFNIICSTLLIPVLGILGAILGTVGAEFLGLIYNLICCKKFIKLRQVFNSFIPFFLIGFFMYILLYFLNKHIEFGTLGLIIKISCGGLLYLSLTILYLFLFSPLKKEAKILVLKIIKKVK